MIELPVVAAGDPPDWPLGDFRLRPIRTADAADWFAYLSDPRVIEHTSYPALDLRGVEAMVARQLDGYAAGTSRRWALADARDVLAGTCGFSNWSLPHAHAELVYDLAPAFHGRGLMRAAVQRVLSWAFEIARFNRVHAHVMTSNAPSIRLLESLGFTREGTLREYRVARGVARDFHVYAQLRSQGLPSEDGDEREGDRVMQDEVQHLLDRGVTLRRDGHLAEAREAFEQALARAKQQRPSRQLALALRFLGQVERDLVHRDAALARYEEALAVCRSLEEKLLTAHTLRHMADLDREASRLDRALTRYSETLAVYRAADGTPPLDLANTFRGLALACEALGRTEEAIAAWSEARQGYGAAGVAEGVSESRAHLRALGQTGGD